MRMRVEETRQTGGRGFAVRRQALAARAPAVIELPMPGGGERRELWRQVALDALANRKVRPFAGAVEVRLTFHDGRPRRLIGDLPNACLELLLAARLIASA